MGALVEHASRSKGVVFENKLGQAADFVWVSMFPPRGGPFWEFPGFFDFAAAKRVYRAPEVAARGAPIEIFSWPWPKSFRGSGARRE